LLLFLREDVLPSVGNVERVGERNELRRAPALMDLGATVVCAQTALHDALAAECPRAGFAK
jgi:hypothetical protein